MNLDGRTVLVTGSSRNIGRAVAETMAEDGADVGITASGDEDGCRETARRVAAAGGKSAVALGDLTDPDAVERVVDTVRDELGPIDVLVNNASIRPRKPFLEVTVAEWNRVHEVNLRGTFLTTQQVLPDMIAREGGSIVNVLGVSAFYGSAQKAHVYASKTGSIGLIRSLATEFGPDGVRVNGVSPGAIDTDRDPEKYPDGWDEDLINAMPLRRLGDPRSVGDACCFLASDRASFITGQVLHVNGGLFPSGNLFG